jgi:competence protein ComEA
MANRSFFSLDLPPIIKKYRVPLGFFLVGLVIFSGGVVLSLSKASEKTEFSSETSVKIVSPSFSPSSENILVDISGAVVIPGVYQLPSDSRLELALQAAGGLSNEADREYVAQNFNLASVLSDGAKVYIPKKGETDFQQTTELSAKKISINTASAGQLETLPGIGPKTAEKIINARPYQKVEDLLLKKIVGQAVFAKIRDRVGV